MEIRFLLMNSNDLSRRVFNHFASNLMISINTALLSYLSTGVRLVLYTMIDVCPNKEHFFFNYQEATTTAQAVGVLIEFMRCQMRYIKLMC